MRRLTIIIAVLAGFVLLGAKTALADVISVPTPFASLAVGGTYTVAGDLTIQNGGSILCNDPASPANNSACDITIVVHGNMTMDAGSAILAENNVASGSGGNITITVDGDLVMHGTIPGIPVTPGAKISSSDTTGGGTTGNAGNITINVGTAGTPPTGDFTMEGGATILADSVNRSAGVIVIAAAKSADVDGLVESFGGMTGVGGANQPPGGRSITVNAGCDLTVSDTGKISSRGQDPGADLVHLQGGCVVNVYGLVESTGVGHAFPTVPPNHCAVAGKPANSTACVEIWAGNSLTIDAKNQNGEINADTGGPGGSTGTSWIDLFARGPISIIGNTVVPFAVHANGKAGTNDNGGIITVKSRDANVLASGLALQADAINPGGSGGSIVVEANGPINLDTASIFARGDFVATGGYGNGGTVRIRSFAGNLSWQNNGVGDVEPTGTLISPSTKRGTITFDRCTGDTVNTSTTTFPSNGAPTTPVDNNVGACGGSPVIPAGVTLPACVCVSVQLEACITVTKFCTDAVALGQPINFNGTVQNCGTDPLSNVTVVDDHATPLNTGDDVTVLGPISLAVGGSQPFSGSYTPGASGPSTDTVTASGTGDNTTVTVTNQASATCSVPAAGGEGCTPGYWKQSQHFGSWPPQYVPTDLVSSVFNVGVCTSLGSKTLLQALSFAGGNTFCEKVQLLLHAGVASVLNAASGSIGFPLTVSEVVSQVNAAIASGDATTVINLQTALDADNNLGCPLN